LVILIGFPLRQAYKNGMSFKVIHPKKGPPSSTPRLLKGGRNYPASDRIIFEEGYAELCRIDLAGKEALEICGGHGELAFNLAKTFPQARVTGLDLYVSEQPAKEGWLTQCPNLSYVAGTAFDLSRFPPNSLDLIWGQAALHHLAHSTGDLGKEAMRVLKPGGRLVFIFEPLGHNLLVAAIRAMRMSLAEMVDESNLFLSQIEKMAAPFSLCEVQVFNLLGYPMKAFSDRLLGLNRLVEGADAFLFRYFPWLRRYAANCNIILTK
jgi:SAM-dependent methyltransferase